MIDLPRPQYQPPADLRPTDRASDLRLPRAATRSDGMFEERIGKPRTMIVTPRRVDDEEKS
jgi:hypothetical protein